MSPVRPRSTATLVLFGVVVPVVACLLLSAVSGKIENTNAALVLVLVVVGAAATGSRVTGWTAAAVSAAGFDFFLTAPYQDFRIHAQADIETTVLLLLIGAAVTELALWGRRQQARASEQRGYLDGLLQTTSMLATTGSAEVVIEQVRLQLEDLLDLDKATFIHHSGNNGRPVLERDGSLSRNGRPVDIDRGGLPTDTEFLLPVIDGSVTLGAFRLVAASHVARPSRQSRQVAVLLADEVATALRHDVAAGLRQDDVTAGLRQDDVTAGPRQDDLAAGPRQDDVTARLRQDGPAQQPGRSETATHRQEANPA